MKNGTRKWVVEVVSSQVVLSDTVYCVVGCKERGGLTYNDSPKSSGNDNNAFVCCATHGVNKQTNKILNPTPSWDRKYQLILAAHRRFVLEDNKLSFSLCFLLTIILAEQFFVIKKCPQKVSTTKKSTKSVDKKCPKKVPTKSVYKKCPQNVSTKRVHKNCPLKCSQNMFTTSVHKKCPQKCS